jgi:multiple sugar transport system substrate-binding protein
LTRGIVAAIVAASLALLAGCTVVKEGKGEVSGPSEPPASGGVKLVMFTWTEAAEEQANQVLLDEFRQANPGIGVELQNSAGSQQAMAKLQTMISAQEAPDLVSLHGAYFVPLASKGALVDLGPYLAKSQELSASDFNKRLLNLCRVDGKLYSLPRYTSVYALFYNKDLFDNAGVPYPDQQEPWDWNAYLQTAKKLTRDTDKDGNTDQWGCIIDFWEARLYPWIWQNGGDIFSRDRSKCTLDSPEAIEAVKFVADLLRVHKVTPETLSTERNQGLEMFSSGKIAMYMTGPWDIQTLNDATRNQGLHWAVAPLPRKKRRATMLGTENYAICSQSKHPDDAWKLFEFLMSSHAQQTMAEKLEKMPSRLSVINGPYVGGDTGQGRRVFAEALDYAVEPPNVPDWAQIRPLYQDELDNIWIGRKSAADGCRDAARAINEYRAAHQS